MTDYSRDVQTIPHTVHTVGQMSSVWCAAWLEQNPAVTSLDYSLRAVDGS